MDGKKIMDESEIVEALDDDAFEDQISDHEGLEATTAPAASGMEFFVQMKGYRVGEFEDAVVEAAARLLVGKRNEAEMARRIEARCVELVTAKIDARLETVSAEIVDQPMTPLFASGKSEPVTMREFIGLVGREYLTTMLDRDGKPTKGGAFDRTGERRIDAILRSVLDRDFKAGIERATKSLISEMRVMIQADLDKVAAAEKERIRKSLEFVLK
jgi:hypothetical protein